MGGGYLHFPTLQGEKPLLKEKTASCLSLAGLSASVWRAAVVTLVRKALIAVDVTCVPNPEDSGQSWSSSQVGNVMKPQGVWGLGNKVTDGTSERHK